MGISKCLLLQFVLMLVDAESTAEWVQYQSEAGTPLTGLLHVPYLTACRRPTLFKESSRPVPGIIVVHSGAGLKAMEKEYAKRLSQLGYVTFAADLYGIPEGQLESTKRNVFRKIATTFWQNRTLLADRLDRAIDILRGRKYVDGNRIGCVGFSLGGLGCLSLARVNAKGLKSVVNHFGRLDEGPDSMARYGPIQSKILALLGDQDEIGTSDDDKIAAFRKEMTDRHADWQLHLYSDTKHMFTDFTNSAAFNQLSTDRAWQTAVQHFKDTL